MVCKYYSQKNGEQAKCSLGFVDRCPFQYWCTNDRCFKPTGDKHKCSHYKEAENSEQPNKK